MIQPNLQRIIHMYEDWSVKRTQTTACLGDLCLGDGSLLAVCPLARLLAIWCCNFVLPKYVPRLSKEVNSAARAYPLMPR